MHFRTTLFMITTRGQITLQIQMKTTSPHWILLQAEADMGVFTFPPGQITRPERGTIW